MAGLRETWGAVLTQAPAGETRLVADLDLERIRQEAPRLGNQNPTAYRWP